MIQAILQGLARLLVWLIGTGPMLLETRRAVAVQEARRRIVMAVGERVDGDGMDGGESVDARGEMGFGAYVDDDDEDGDA